MYKTPREPGQSCRSQTPTASYSGFSVGVIRLFLERNTACRDMSPLTLLRITITLFPHVAEDGSGRYTPATIFYLSVMSSEVNGNRPAFICMETVHHFAISPMVMVFLGPPIATTIPSSELPNRTRGQSNRSARSASQ